MRVGNAQQCADSAPVSIQNDSGLPQGRGDASAAASACGKLHFAEFGRARRGCMLEMRRRGFIMLLGGRPGGHETGQREAKTKVPPNAE
jgi:hypothetical protein